MLPCTAAQHVHVPTITFAPNACALCRCGLPASLMVPPSANRANSHVPELFRTTNRKQRHFKLRHSTGTDNGTEGSVVGSVAEEVKASRYFRHLGILVGTGLFVTSALLGSLIGIVDPAFILALVTSASAYLYFNTQRYNEESEPLPNTSFEVRE